MVSAPCVRKMEKSKKISVLLCFLVVFVGLVNGAKKSHKHHHAGIKAQNEHVGIYELKSGRLHLKLTNWGASIMSLHVPDKHGKWADIALGYNSTKEYMRNDKAYLGAIVGRVANWIGGANFSLNGTQHKLVANDGQNTLNGGSKGFSDVAWKVSKHHNTSRSKSVIFTYRSKDGEQGFPGELHATVAYTLLGNNSLSVTMTAKALKKPTPVNLAQHTYWNLGGHNSGNILSHEVQIFGSHYTPLNSQHIPTGKIASVKGTKYDFLKSHTIGSRIKKLHNGYDLYYILDGEKGHHKIMKKAAIVHDKKSGRVLELSTNAPGVQFDTSNNLKNVKGKGGVVYKPRAGLSLVTQGYPDAVNHPNFPSQIVTPSKPYRHTMLFKFTTKAAHKV